MPRMTSKERKHRSVRVKMKNVLVNKRESKSERENDEKRTVLKGSLTWIQCQTDIFKWNKILDQSIH